MMGLPDFEERVRNPFANFSSSKSDSFLAVFNPCAIMGGVSSWLWQSNSRANLAAPLPEGVAGLNEQTGKLFCNMITKGKFRLTWRCDGSEWSDPAEAARAAGPGGNPRPLKQCDSCAGKQDEYERACAAAAGVAAAAGSAAAASSSAAASADPVAPAAASDSNAR
jgi:hypothetical protein